MTLNTDLTRLTKINLKNISDINMKYLPIKILENKIGENLDDLGYGDNTTDVTLKAQLIKEIIHQLGFI